LNKIKESLFEHGVVCIKNQNLNASEQVEFSKKFGELIERPSYYANLFREPGIPSIIRIGNVRSNGEIVNQPKDAEVWHKDGSFE
jgi:taurine dioxygenase